MSRKAPAVTDLCLIFDPSFVKERHELYRNVEEDVKASGVENVQITEMSVRKKSDMFCMSLNDH